MPALPSLRGQVMSIVLRLPAAMIHVLERGELLVRQNRMRHPQPVGVLLGRFEQVPLRADVALQRHDHFFADRIDRRIGDLGEELLEVVVEHPRLVGEARQARVVAHRADRVAQLAHQRQQHELHRLDRVAERLHPLEQRLRLEAVRLLVGCQVVEVDPLVARATRHTAGGWRSRCFSSSSGISRPCSKSTRNMRPGCRRPLALTFCGSMRSTPTSLAMITRSSCVR